MGIGSIQQSLSFGVDCTSQTSGLFPSSMSFVWFCFGGCTQSLRTPISAAGTMPYGTWDLPLFRLALQPFQLSLQLACVMLIDFMKYTVACFSLPQTLQFFHSRAVQNMCVFFLMLYVLAEKHMISIPLISKSFFVNSLPQDLPWTIQNRPSFSLIEFQIRKQMTRDYNLFLMAIQGLGDSVYTLKSLMRYNVTVAIENILSMFEKLQCDCGYRKTQ